MKIFFLILLLSVSALARLTDGQFDIKIESEKVSIIPKAGFHLNEQAPASAVMDDLEALMKPTTKTQKLFAFKKAAKSKKASLNFYVCDDKNTVCEKHEQSLNFKSGEIKKTEIKANYNSLKEFNLKSTDGRPTLLVFSAPWCPACIRMVTETYHKPEVQKQLKKLNFVKLNSDLPENNELSDKFKIKAIPTLILLDKNGQESYRWLDFQPAGVFAKSVESELQKVDLIETNIKSAQLGDISAASALAFKAYNTLDYAEALKWFALTKSANDKKYKLSAEVNLAQEKAEDEKSNLELLKVLEKAAALTDSKLDQIRWTKDYLEKKSELKKYGNESIQKTKDLIKDIDFLITNEVSAANAFKESSYGDYTGFEKIELLWMKAKLLTLMDAKDEVKAVNEQTIAQLEAKRLSTDRPGEMLMAIAYMKEAGEVKKVEMLYKQLIAKFPTTYVYFEKYARFAQKNKEFEKALDLTNEALKFPEGNQPQLSLLKVQILKDMKKNEEALAAIEATLKLEYIDHKRYSRTIKKLSELKNELKENFTTN